MTMAACPGNQELLFWRDHIPKESLSPACRGDWVCLSFTVCATGNPSEFIFDFIVNRKMPSYSSSRSATCCCGFADLVDLCRFPKTDSLRPPVVTGDTEPQTAIYSTRYLYPALLSCPTNRIVLFLLFTESDISRGQPKEATISSSTGSIEAIVGAVENGPLSQQSNEQPGRNSIHLILKCTN